MRNDEVVESLEKLDTAKELVINKKDSKNLIHGQDKTDQIEADRIYCVSRGCKRDVMLELQVRENIGAWEGSGTAQTTSIHLLGSTVATHLH